MRLNGKILVKKSSSENSMPRNIRILNDHDKYGNLEYLDTYDESIYTTDITTDKLLENYDVCKHSYVITLNKIKLPVNGKSMFDLVITVNKNSRLEKENVLVFSLLTFLLKGCYINKNGKPEIASTSNPEEYINISEYTEFDEDYTPILNNLNVVDKKVYFFYNHDKNFDYMKFNIINWLCEEVINDSNPDIVLGYDGYGFNFNFVKGIASSLHHIITSAKLYTSIQSVVRVYDLRYMMYKLNSEYHMKDISKYIATSGTFIEFLESNKDIPDEFKKVFEFIKSINIYPDMPCIPFNSIDFDSIYFVDMYHNYPVVCEEVLEKAKKHNSFIAELYIQGDKRTLFMVYRVKESDAKTLTTGEPVMNDDELSKFFKIKK